MTFASERDPQRPGASGGAVRSLLLGKVVSGRQEQLCRIRSVSRAGLTLESRGRLASGRYVRVQLRNGREVSGNVVWSGEDRSELRFDAPLDPNALLGDAPGKMTGRAPRIAAAMAIRITCGGRIAAARLIDLSQSGARLQTRARLAEGDTIMLSIPALDTLQAVIRRVEGQEIGIALLQPIGFDKLACWAEKYVTGTGGS